MARNLQLNRSQGAGSMPPPTPPHRGPRRLTRSLPAESRHRPEPPPGLLDAFLPAKAIEIPPSADEEHLFEAYIIHLPPVPEPPCWLPGSSFGRNDHGRDGGLQLRDTRSLDKTFPFPLEDFDFHELERIPDKQLAKIITDKSRAPVISFRHDTRNTISRISHNLVAKWGPGVTQVEADMMWLIQGMRVMRNHVPRIHRVFRDELTGYLFIIMDYISGDTFVDVWNGDSLRKRTHAVLDITQVVGYMQKETSRFPGPVGMNRLQALVHGDFPAPFRMDGLEYEQYLNTLVDKINKLRPAHDRAKYMKFDRSDKFILTNSHLDPTSFIIDDKGIPWIVGWGKSCYSSADCELALAERCFPLKYITFVLALVNRVAHNEKNRRAILEIAAFIEGDPHGLIRP
ncbi:uncharacterized protein F4822DRAFT_140620 [Hypoxylon trugodes]|uniref:uncharacterized protein n=1 Tax=Hypoxylon trugodes TaxID=326681 RepID=UPI0021935963|nr:uncharacterized protein F4822DRAFT_140620 [Hypoxylon trugodes]KAI1392777.1 hypothetical protein F4822DRAFT_140620 [Hypoxylon trugodes]